MPRLTTLLLLVLALAFARVATASDAVAQRATTSPLATPAAAVKKRRRLRPLGLRVVHYARHLLGVRYTWGGSSPRTGFDCSGFVRFVWAHFGVNLPRDSYEQFDRGHRVPRGSLRPGDLVFFDGAGHVGLYIGHGHFIHAPHTGTVVSIASLNGSYARVYDGARRVD